jgi:NTE family protein
MQFGPIAGLSCARRLAGRGRLPLTRHHALVRSTRRPDVLVLGGGGVLGEAWLRACLAGLEAETGWDLRECDAFVGTSAGSIVAAVLAAGRRPVAARSAGARRGEATSGDARSEAGWERDAAATRNGDPPVALRRGIATLARLAGTAAAPLAPAVAAATAPGGAAVRAALLRRGRRATREIPQLREAVERMDGTFDGRLLVAAVELATGRRVMFGAPGAPPAGVTEAVLASCAVPWVFRPVTIGGREYVDGGFWSAANLDAAPVRRGSEVLCLVPTASPRLSVDRLGALRAFASAGVAAESLVLRRRGARVRIVVPDAATVEAIGPNLFDVGRRAPVEAAGYAQGRTLAS